METTILLLFYYLIGTELTLLAEFQDLLWLRLFFDVGCTAVKEAK